MNPIVSVIVPMFNAEHYIRGALESILCEERISIEVIIVDDRSTDSSRHLVNELHDSRVRILDGDNRGIAACLNAGLAEARGSIIMRCDADDIYPRERIMQQVLWLNSHPEFSAVCGSFSTIDKDGRLVAKLLCGDSAMEINDELIKGIVRTHLCTFAIRSSILSIVQGFREYFETAEDLDFQFRLSSFGRIFYVPENWYFYRIHSSSITHTQKSTRRLFFEEMAKKFQRQRTALGSDDLQNGLASAPPESERSSVLTASKHIQSMLFGIAWEEHRRGRKRSALVVGTRALAEHFASVTAWKSFLALAVKPARKRP